MTQNTILITGGTGKLGQIFVKHFVNKGWRVVITTTNKSNAINLKKSYGRDNPIDVFVKDLMKPDASRKLVQDILETGIKINHLVNNARSLNSLKVGENGQSSRESLAEEYLLDVIVPYELTMSLYSLQRKSLQTVTNIGSQYGSVAANPYLYDGEMSESPIQYGLAKASLHHLTKELAVRFAKDKIRVNCIAFGGITGRVDGNFKERYAKLVPMGRMLDEDEVIGPLKFLISDDSSSVTGEILAADGGWTIW